MVVGHPGTDKTAFAAKFVYEGARRFGEPSLYICNVDGKDGFYSCMAGLGMDFGKLERRGFLQQSCKTS